MRFSTLLGGPALLLAACSGNNQADNTVNADQSLSAESFSSNDVTAIDAVTGDASNMAADVNYVAEANALDDSGGNDNGGERASAKSGADRRSSSQGAASNTASSAPEPAANAASATGNNAL